MKITPFNLGLFSFPIYFFTPLLFLLLSVWCFSRDDTSAWMLAFVVATGVWMPILFLLFLLSFLAACVTGWVYSWWSDVRQI
jgi:hypothetical protein